MDEINSKLIAEIESQIQNANKIADETLYLIREFTSRSIPHDDDSDNDEHIDSSESISPELPIAETLTYKKQEISFDAVQTSAQSSDTNANKETSEQKVIQQNVDSDVSENDNVKTNVAESNDDKKSTRNQCEDAIEELMRNGDLDRNIYSRYGGKEVLNKMFEICANLYHSPALRGRNDKLDVIANMFATLTPLIKNNRPEGTMSILQAMTSDDIVQDDPLGWLMILNGQSSNGGETSTQDTTSVPATETNTEPENDNGKIEN